MPEVTDSYCERCGARYAFTPNMPKSLSLKGARVLARGLKNFVLTDGQSMADALTLARNEDNHQDSSRMTEAFHRTFNFCMTCRQYACERCWNAKAGACLSCAPTSSLEPVAPEDHLIVRTPVARWDTDWSLFPEGPAAEPLARPAPPAPFNEPIRLEDPQQPLPTRSPAVPMWPAGDLPTDPAPQSAAGRARKGRNAYQKSVDAQAAGLWPITDEIAPEMTLTPEELELVETRLGQAETAEAVETPEAAQAAPDPGLPTDLAPAGATWNAPAVPAWVAKNVEPHSQPALTAPVSDWSSSEPTPDAQVQPKRILRMSVSSPALPPLGHPTPEPPTHGHAPIVARLLGRHDLHADEGASTRRRRTSGRRPQPAGDPWPHVTEWSNRPLENHDWWAADTDASFDEIESEPAWPNVALPAALAEPSGAAPQDVDRRPAALGLPGPSADARTAAAVRLSAVAAAGSDATVRPDFLPEPAESDEFPALAQQPLFDLSEAAREHRSAAESAPTELPVADQDVLEAIRNMPVRAPQWTPARRSARTASTSQAPAGPDSPRTTPPGPWPPLGASWPAQGNANAPWPGPEGAPVPAIVAAGQVVAPILAEVWAQSAQEVLNRGSVRVCHHCALPVSTQARYCRRCGTQQA